MHALAEQFNAALGLINIDEGRRQHAIDAHTEIRQHLEGDPKLRDWGVDTVLIGSYARQTGIQPGKDVDVFCKLTNVSTSDVHPSTIYEHVRDLLLAEYGSRATPQARSVAVSFDRDGFEFSVDAVPAVRAGERWAIPRHDTSLWDEPAERWVATDPERLARLTSERNAAPLVGSQGAYIPVVKLVRQTRRHHRADSKPGGFYFELMTYWAFANGDVPTGTFAEIFAHTLRSIADHLARGEPLTDPALGTDYLPKPDPSDLSDAAATFGGLALMAEEATVEASRCKAAVLWRQILGQNDQGWCFPIPDGCDEHGNSLIPRAANHVRVSEEPGAFA